MYALLTAKNGGLREEALSFARELIRTPSPSLQESAVARLVEAKMQALGYDQVFADEYGNVVGIMWGRAGESTVLLSSHMDTADAGELPFDEFDRQGGLHVRRRELLCN